MNKITRVKNSNYTTISNVFLRDKELSLKAKGLLATVLSLPETWDFSIKGICTTIKEGTTAVYSAIDELKERGYCKVAINRNEKGMIIGNDYTFYEDPNVENPNMDNQSQINKDKNNNSLPNTKDNLIKEENKENKKESDDLFETCWVSYRRKGNKKRAKEYWRKLTDAEKQNVMPHIKAYVKSRDLCYQKDFERYLRDKTFNEIIINGNNIVYDPTKLGKGEIQSTVYMPTCDGALSWNDYYNCFMYVGYWDGRHIPDGYDDDNRPDGASVTLNNGRGVLVWDKETKQWKNARY